MLNNSDREQISVNIQQRFAREVGAIPDNDLENLSEAHQEYISQSCPQECIFCLVYTAAVCQAESEEGKVVIFAIATPQHTEIIDGEMPV